jgi:response regulator RpfG family c-di-GMP phosphodiesterase
MTREEALEELSRCSGSQFDPTVVEKFAEMEERREAVEGIEGAEKQQ